MQKQFFGFSNQQDNDSTEMIPERFKIDAFLVLIDVSKERMEKQELQRQKGLKLYFLLKNFFRSLLTGKTEIVTTLKKTTRFCRANSEKHKTKKLPSCTWTDQIRSDWTTDCN